MNRFKYSFDETVKQFKILRSKSKPLEYLSVDISLLFLGCLLILFVSTLYNPNTPVHGLTWWIFGAITVIGYLLLLLGLLSIFSPLLIIIESFWYFILILIFPIKQNSNNEAFRNNCDSDPISKIEVKLRELNKLEYVSEISGFPFDSFQKLKDAVHKNEYTIGIEYSAATEAATFINTRFVKILLLILAIIPWIILSFAIIFALILKNYYLFFAIPIVGLTFVFSNPLNPRKNYISIVGYLGTVVLLFFVLINNQTIFWLLSSFAITFWSVRAFYKRNTIALREAIMNSEIFFTYSYKKKAITIRNNQTGKVYKYNG
ncbi:hypothetical protein HZA55_06215 [Candidatus Poribacteria bacterium]|nr:hypothetical protein [Candidatus Poribacteria bacterium]